MELSFAREVKLLARGQGEVFQGEGIVAVTKALLQSGVGYVGGYQGAPVSHLLDVITSTPSACTSKHAPTKLPPAPCSQRR